MLPTKPFLYVHDNNVRLFVTVFLIVAAFSICVICLTMNVLSENDSSDNKTVPVDVEVEKFSQDTPEIDHTKEESRPGTVDMDWKQEANDCND